MLNYDNGSPSAISGASLAQLVRRMSAPQRAILAADILDGRTILQGLTAKSIAMIVGASPAYVWAALRCSPERREQIKRGERPLIPSQPRAVPATTTIDWAAVDDVALTDIVRTIGIDRALNAAVAAEHATLTT
jgi:hypothetical protein